MEIAMDAEIIFKYFPDLSVKQQEQIKMLYPLYVHWNQQINVISRKDIEELYIRHVLHALGIAKYCQFLPQERVLDVGTGGGFPGIPLAIAFPETQFTLVDSIGKKIKVVNEVARVLQLQNVKAIHARAEEVKDTFHFVVSRAVTRLANFYPWIKDKFENQQINTLKNGLLYLKGGYLAEEISESKLNAQLWSLADVFREHFFETKYVLYVPKVRK